MKTKGHILVAGGAGYIGSVAVKKLIEENYEVTVVDNLSKGKRELVHKKAHFYEFDILEEDKLEDLFEKSKFDAVIHFAALKNAGESMIEPQKYSQNIKGTINILNAMANHNVKKIVFSSSAAVYGNPKENVVDENHQTEPINFYGATKLEGERIMRWFSELKNITCISLRYFNLAGDGGLDYIDPNASNVFPIIAETLYGLRESFSIYGDDYNTKDGTGIRDYIHVIDLVDAHIMALKLEKSDIINLGTQTGYSVMDLIEGFEKASKKKLNYKVIERRPGDPAYLVASNKKAKEVLGWEPKLGLKEMIESTLKAYDKL